MSDFKLQPPSPGDTFGPRINGALMKHMVGRNARAVGQAFGVDILKICCGTEIRVKTPSGNPPFSGACNFEIAFKVEGMVNGRWEVMLAGEADDNCCCTNFGEPGQMHLNFDMWNQVIETEFAMAETFPDLFYVLEPVK